MLHRSESDNKRYWTRRKILQYGLVGGATITAFKLFQSFNNSALAVAPPISQQDLEVGDDLTFNPMSILRDFDYGTLKIERGRKIREFQVLADSSVIPLNSAINYVSWNLNGRVPGPTLRVKEGERLRVVFENADGHSHSMHFHGTHPEEMDGVKPVRRGKSTIYEFDAKPFGVHPYHCHVAPVTRHVSKGLYGLLIVDPPQGRPPADEMVLVMGGYDIHSESENTLYAFNGIPNYYRDRPISIYQNQLIRLYLLNMIEFDPAVTFHIHANMFRVFPTGRTLKPQSETDVITMGTAERHILEFSYPYTGRYMFHPHQDYIAEKGCMGYFDVISR